MLYHKKSHGETMKATLVCKLGNDVWLRSLDCFGILLIALNLDASTLSRVFKTTWISHDQ